ncbi:unnamed protein product [Rotaria sordida]|uniref:Uncharacterized protein n=2 Tax=Rotaria sordida TaxID=392033 RepID=A0A818SYG4_9BILA|nr:unnamed protein product [Rotaria sordida]
MQRTATKNLMACVGYTSNLTTRSLAIDNKNHKTLRKYSGKSFFYAKNYKSILDCLDGGYQISMDLIEYMQDYSNLLQEHINRLNSYSNKWKSKIKQQSVLSSYNTTKRAQLETVRTPNRHAELLQNQHDVIQNIIVTYRTQVEQMYPNERFSTSHKHYRTDTKKNLFKAAYSSLSELSNKLEQLREQQEIAQNALDDANAQYENLCSDEIISKNKMTNAKEKQKKRKDKLGEIKREIVRTEEEYNQEQEIYRVRATKIYEECRILEQERLDLIGETLIKFSEIAFSSEYLTEQDEIYEDLMSKLQTQRNSLKDLNFWAQTYGVYGSTTSLSSQISHNGSISSETTTRKAKKSHKSEMTNTTTIEGSVIEDEEEQSQAHSTTTNAMALNQV